MAASEEEPNQQDLESTEKQVVRYMQSKGITMAIQDIETCHPLPRKDKNLKPAIIIRFANRKHKKEVLKQGKKLKGSDVYINEHLT